MRKQHRVVLSETERESLLEQIHQGRGSAQDLAHARILLKADVAAARVHREGRRWVMQPPRTWTPATGNRGLHQSPR